MQFTIRTLLICGIFMLCNRLHSSPLKSDYRSDSFNTNKRMTVYDSIMHNIWQVQWENNIVNIRNVDANSKSYQESQLADGAWSDINYASTSQTSWNPGKHLSKLKTMALSVSYSSSLYYNNEAMCNNIARGLQFWYDRDPRSTNWYNQQIASPKLVGEILILLEATKYPIQSVLKDSLLNRMIAIGGAPSNSFSVSGSSNKINIACHWIYRGCLTANADVLQIGVDSSFAPIEISAPSLGIQVDYSYQEHKKQLYIANYGTEFINNVTNAALYLQGTKYALSGDKLDIMSKYARGIFMRSMRGNYSTFSATGRQISNVNKLKTSNASIFRRMQILDVTNAPIYDTALKRLSGIAKPSFGINPKHFHYWISDYTTHTRPGYSFDVRAVSTRTTRTEQVNDENLKGHFLPDGATNIQLDGDEYYNIFPSWDWARVPGTTTPHYADLPNMTKKYYNGTTSFVGGVSDSLYGVNTYEMSLSNLFNIKAKKSWFYFEKEIVCLGVDIQSSATEDVNTTVNQCLQKGSVVYNNGTEHKFAFGSSSESLGNIKWVLHNRVGYVFPSVQTIGIGNETRSGNWYSIATSQKDATVNNDVFTLWINHGSRPVSSKYEYVVVPNVNNTSTLDSYVSSSKISIERNDDTIQCVYNKEIGLWGMVIFRSNAVYSAESFKIWTDAPCVMMFRRSTSGVITGYISDPTQLLEKIQVNVSEGQNQSNTKMTTVTLPAGSYAGSTVAFEIK